ncbi:MAG: TlpA family protein disulfide reductase [Bacteroidia bacterium]|nr:TlpA family protein disulfide reductase [Bacteroidia bacterium]
MYSNTDYITNTRFKDNQDTIAADGFFEITCQTDYVKPVFLKIENVVSQLYIQPNFVYGITIPEVERGLDYKNDAELPVNIGIVGTDSTELNALMFDYQEQYNNFFIKDNGQYISRAQMFVLADSLQKLCDKRYSGIKNTYFKNYILYSIASINASVSRGENYLINGYILKHPIQYHHYEYMQFFETCFKGYLNTVASQHKGQSLYNIINSKASYKLLRDFLKDDKFLRNDTIKELVIIKNMWDFYFNPDFEPDAVESIVSQLSVATKNAEHKRICSNMLAYFNKLQVGSQAPDFSARSRDGKMASLGMFKGRWVYLNFFSTANTESLKEMPKIAALKKKYGDKVTFVSVCVDDSLKTYTAYLRANPKYDWNIWYNQAGGLTKTAKEQYSVTGSEAYYLISNAGYLAQSPALSPSNGIEYRFNIIFKIKQKNFRTGIR